MTKRNNASATELWAQVFSNQAKGDAAAIMDPDYDPALDEAKAREGFRSAGWSESETELRMQVHREAIANAPVTSPGTNPHVEVWFERLCHDIEAAMERLNLDSHLRIARGVEPIVGPSASKIGVVMTDESIITIGAHTFRFCGLIARAFTRTLHLNPHFWEAGTYSPDEARLRLRKSFRLMTYWRQIYQSYVLTGTNFLVPFEPATKYELMLFEQVARAMELFAIAHEYGHHHLRHGKKFEGDPKDEEYEADQFALRVCYEIERQPLIMPNPYLSSGSGGVILLSALATLREIDSFITGIKVPLADSHPGHSDRICRFRSVALLRPAEFSTLRAFRLASGRIMDSVHSELLDSLKLLPRTLVEKIATLKVIAD